MKANENQTSIVINAINKNIAFHNELTKNLAGISLIQRSINIAQKLALTKKNIYVVTDSEEVKLICDRNKVEAYLDKSLINFNPEENNSLFQFLEQTIISSNLVFIFSPYAPLLSLDLFNEAKLKIIKSKANLLISSRNIQHNKIDETQKKMFFAKNIKHSYLVDSNYFLLIKKEVIESRFMIPLLRSKLFISENYVEINSQYDWWICEKLLKRKLIIFRIIGNNKVGMGHIYRALSLAHEISNHQLIFVSDAKDLTAIKILKASNYHFEIFESDDIIEKILHLKPNLVINDILSTTKEDVLPFKEKGIGVVNFEDLGDGALVSNFTINELFDKPKFDGENIFWGHEYCFLRDEFIGAKSNQFKENVTHVLLTFGGTDPNNLVTKIFNIISSICADRGIIIKIVMGAGFNEYENLFKLTKGNEMVSITKETGVMSSIMENTQVAISSNGRTVYELAHMRIPSIIISQHQREETHQFAIENHGFISAGIIEDTVAFNEQLIYSFNQLLDDRNYRHKLFNKTQGYDFLKNKKNVLDILLSAMPD